MPAINYILTISTLEKIQQITDYINDTLKNPSAAQKLVIKIRETLEQVCTFPTGFESIGIIKNYEYRKVLVNNYVLFYRIKEDVVIVDYIEYSKRDKKKILKALKAKT